MQAQVVLMKDVVLDRMLNERSSVVELRDGSTPLVGALRGGKQVPVHPSTSHLSDSNDENTSPITPEATGERDMSEQAAPSMPVKVVPQPVHLNEKSATFSGVESSVDADMNDSTLHTEQTETDADTDADTYTVAEKGIKPHWNPSTSSYYPLLKKSDEKSSASAREKSEGSESADSSINEEERSYIIPKVSSSLVKSYDLTWKKMKSKAPQSHAIMERIQYDAFRTAVSINEVELAADTSITGRYARKNYIPFGFEPSTEEACKQEEYEVIKLSKTSKKEDEKSDATPQQISPLLYYQSWDPVTMRYEPKLKSSEVKSPMSKTFPLGAAAAGTRAALLSFMGTRAPNITQSPVPSMSPPSDRPFLKFGDISASSGRPTSSMTASQSRAQTPTATNVPEKIIIHPHDDKSIQRIVPSENNGGGKKIENVDDSIVRKRKRGDDDDEDYLEEDKSNTDSSSKQTLTSSVDTDDAICDGSPLRRGTRQRTSRKFFR